MISNKDIFWINRVIKLTNYAEKEGEIPVSAILVLKNKNIFTESWNKSIKLSDPTAHAEIIVIRNFCKKIKNYRALNTTLYVTLEPCIMCIGAILNARISKLVYILKSNKKNNINYISLLNKIQIINISLYKEFIKNKYLKKIKNFFIKKR